MPEFPIQSGVGAILRAGLVEPVDSLSVVAEECRLNGGPQGPLGSDLLRLAEQALPGLQRGLGVACPLVQISLHFEGKR